MEPTPQPATEPRATDLRARLGTVMLRDERRLRRRLDKARNDAGLADEIAAAERKVAARQANLPEITYPDELPVSARRDDIAAAIAGNQVVVVAGETGSGKTTQLPKICLELGRGVRGLIGHTQPRRLAARTVSDRIAAELGSSTGDAIGYAVRFTDQVGPNTLVKLMTDGILLAEIPHDRDLLKYDTLIIDEAHERSLNIDFVLGYVKQLLPRRPDLKVIITSATIDPERFAAHFAVDGKPAPIVEVSGRTYPVEVRYRPPEAKSDQTQSILGAVDELATEPAGDILVFCSGEREIRDTADALDKHLRYRPFPVEVLPLFARLSAGEQLRVFQPHGNRRIVLATNVAETSVTVPGIRYVIDPGTARISRYSVRSKVQRLPIERVSQASANQRKGRCGRLADGICVRLYEEEDFESRPEFTDPEILRTNLASVILQMTALGLGDIAAFPFLDPPDRRAITDGVNLLHELGALDRAQPGRLTPLGKQLAQLPVDPRLGRMVLAAAERNCLREVVVIAAALSIQDPRERPADEQGAADAAHARFAEKESDFLAYLNLWNHLADRQRELSGNQFRRLCRAEYLNYLRVREWQDIDAQIRQVLRQLGMKPADTRAEPRAVHQALLAGLLSHLGVKDPDTQEYLGARGTRFAVFPGSGLFRRPPRWIMSAELVETARLYARVNAKIEPEWAEELAAHLVVRTYSEPRWDARRGAVMATEKVTLYGLPIVAGRRIPYSSIDPELSRELFIRHALVEGDWDSHHAFLAHNRTMIDDVAALEDRARRRDLLADDETLFAFYDARIGEEAVSARHFDSWWKQARRADPALLDFTPELVVNQRAAAIAPRDYPDGWLTQRIELPVSYTFEPGTSTDGVTVDIPLAVLNQVDGTGFDWQVPGLRQDLVAGLLRSLPKGLRRAVGPAPDYARAFLTRTEHGRGPLLAALERDLRQHARIEVPRDAWHLGRLPGHLRITFRVLDDAGAVVAEGKDLAALRDRLRARTQQVLTAGADPDLTRTGLRTWEVGTLPKVTERHRDGLTVRAYPALTDDGDSVSVRMYDTPEQQRDAMWRGTRRLLRLTLPPAGTLLKGRLTNEAKLALSRHPHRDVADLLDDCLDAAVDALSGRAGGPAWDPDGFGTLRDAVRADLADTLRGVLDTVREILTVAHRVTGRLDATTAAPLRPAVTDMREQLDGLVYRGFVTATGTNRLPDVLRYVRGIDRRLDKLPADPGRDAARMRTVHEVAAEAAGHDEIRWMVEELRISYFAQQLGTAYPVSDVRIYRALDAAR